MTGFINVNKAVGVSSAQEVGRIKRLTGCPCGHMGTLDPMASGVLPVAIGNAARLFDYFLSKHKTYVATFRFGADSDTLDTTGSVTENAGRVPDKDEISAVLYKFVGEIMQIPPKYSAKNINGTRGYRLARAGVEFELAPKKVDIFSLELIKQVSCDSFIFEIKCGGGTYVRSIARDIAKELGTYAVMSALKRTQSGVFSIENSVESSILTAENIGDYVIPTDSVLPFESIFLDERQTKRLLNGLSDESTYPDGMYKMYTADGLFYGLAEVSQSQIKVRTKLC